MRYRLTTIRTTESQSRMDINHLLRTSLMLTMALSFTGCKSGWKMPGGDMFSWNRKPSPAALAAEGPSMTLPTSPAKTETPTQLASTGGRTASPTSGYSMPTSGGAASKNGYQTGPYGMAANSKYPNMTPASSSSPAPTQLAGMSRPTATGGLSKADLQTPAASDLGDPPSLQSPRPNPNGSIRPTQPSYAMNPAATQQYGGAPSSPNYGSVPTTASASGYGSPALSSPSSNGLASSALGSSGLASGALSPPPSGAAPTGYGNSSYAPVSNTAGLGSPNGLAAPGATSYASSPTATAPMSNNSSLAGPKPAGFPAQTASNTSGGYRPGSTRRSTGFAVPSGNASASAASTYATSSPYTPLQSNGQATGQASGLATGLATGQPLSSPSLGTPALNAPSYGGLTPPPASNTVPQTANGMSNQGYSVPQSINR